MTQGPIESYKEMTKLQDSLKQAMEQQRLQKALAERPEAIAAVNFMLLKSLKTKTKQMLSPCSWRWIWNAEEGYGQLVLRQRDVKLTGCSESLQEFLNAIMQITGVISVQIIEGGAEALYQWDGKQWLKG